MSKERSLRVSDVSSEARKPAALQNLKHCFISETEGEQTIQVAPEAKSTSGKQSIFGKDFQIFVDSTR